MKKKFKALIIDCDGTLMETGGVPTDVVMKAVIKAASLIHVGIATQRTLLHAHPILLKLKLSGPSIISGGAQVIDSQTLKILHEELIDNEELLKAIKVLSDFKKKNNFKLIIQNNQGKDDIEWTGGVLPKKIITVLAFNFELKVAEEIENKISTISNLSVHKVLSHMEGKFGLSITAALATKQQGIFKVAKILGIDTHEIIGIGDGYNDFPLLMACGLKVAMGNAVEDLKAIADYIAPTVSQDGVADVINKFVL